MANISATAHNKQRLQVALFPNGLTLSKDGFGTAQDPLALDQKRGQTPEPKLIKPTWEKDFDQLRDSDRSARLPDYRDWKGRRTAEDIGPLSGADNVCALWREPVAQQGPVQSGGPA